ncbi:MAG TPA: zinc-dependent metalloprotease [Chthonomonadaceae bacterium]|nr:zinc-dependent metalloprotease [Chthonomonadaceae bacterium]
MRQGVKTALLVWLMAIIGVSSLAQDKVSLAYKAKTGQTARYKSQATLSLDAGGMKLNLDIKEVEKVTITGVAPSGDITQDSVTESSEMTINGQKAPDENPDKSVTTVVYHPDGTLVSYKSTNDKAETKEQVRLRNTGNILFPTRPIGVGDKWSFTVAADPKLGSEEGKADCEVLASEKINGIDTFKIKMVYKETTFKPALSATNIIWVEKSSGDGIQSDTDIENVQFGGDKGPMASGKMHSERIEGSPLGDVKGAQGNTAKADTKPEPKKEKTIDDTVKDYEKIPGLFTLYRKKENNRETVYMEIKESQLDKLFLLQATAATGTAGRVVPSDDIGDILFKFSKSPNDQLLMVTPNTDFRIDPTKPLARALKRSFPDAYIESFRIEAQQPDRKSLLINVSELFKGDIAGATQIFFGGGGSSYGMDREKTYIGAWKNFPDNLVVETNYHFIGSLRSIPGSSFLGGHDQLADPRSIPLKVVYNLFPLPVDDGYVPRLSDGRIGYFPIEFQSFDDDSKANTKVHYISRWNLQKADPNLALSPPKKPIVFWLDNAIPLEYRDTVRDALLMWNPAFERIGIKDAIVVKQMPDNADWDPADTRYNVVLWIASESSAYARADPRVNPITGEILGGKIIVDANFVRGIKMERQTLVNPAAQIEDPNPIPHQGNKSRFVCEMGEGMMMQAQFGWMALDMLNASVAPITEVEYTRQYLRESVAHEMGHILGLRHNFVASSYHTADELGNGDLIHKTGLTGSLMDYNAFNVFALKKKGVEYFASALGPYDKWAIEYGYVQTGAQTPEAERDRLQLIASRDNQPGLGYESDEVADSFDPNVTRFDMGKDPLDYWTKNFQVTRYLLFNLDQREPKHGESYWEFTRSFNGLMNYYASSAANTLRYIGGLHYNRNHRGDWAEKPTLAPISGEDQRRALNLLNTFIFSEEAFAFPKSYFVKMTDNPMGGLTLQSFLSGGNSFPIKDQLAGVQTAVLKRLFSSSVLSRISNNEFKVAKPSQTLTLPELFNSIHGTVWSELKGGKSITELHRQLQRADIDVLITMSVSPSGGTPDDARMLAWNELRQLKTQIAAVKDVSKDTYTHIHLEESLMRINRALNAQQTIGGSGSSRPLSLADLLGETQEKTQGQTQP